VKAFVISLSKIESSFTTAQAMVEPLTSFGFDVELFEGTYGNDAVNLVRDETRTLHPTNQNGEFNSPNFKVSGPGVIGCFYSHYNLWKKCVELNETIFIFEDDVTFVRPYIPVEFNEILIVAMGSWTSVFSIDIYQEPDCKPCAKYYPGRCLPGAVGYGITPTAAKKLITEFSRTYTSADSAIRSSVVDIKIHSHLIGRALIAEDGKVSLTRSKNWIKK
jgi:GR25 family glycosyltransferase involved in LPS biosynthesis